MAPSSTLTLSPLKPTLARTKTFTVTPLAGFLRKHRHLDENLQALSNHDGHLLHIAPVEPRAAHNITAARKHILDAVWITGGWIFADRGYQRACPEITTPLNDDRLNPDEDYREDHHQRPWATESGNTALKHYKALQNVSPCTNAIAKTTQVISLHYAPNWRS